MERKGANKDMVNLLYKYLSGELDCTWDEFLDILLYEFEFYIEQEIHKKLRKDGINESEIINDFNY